MPIDSSLLEILCCPETGKKVELVSEELLNQINEKIRQGTLKNKSGELLQEELEHALIRKDGKLIYPIRNGIPVMLSGEAVSSEV